MASAGQRGQGPQSQVGTRTIQVRDFSAGLVRTGSRPGIPENALWQAINGQVIGPGQILTLAGPATPIVTFGTAVVSLWSTIIAVAGVETSYLISIHADGSARAIVPTSGAVTVIATAGQLTSAARLTTWKDTHVLFGDPTKGVASWDGTTFVTYPATFTADITNALSTITWTGGTASTALVAGMGLAGTGIPAGTVILSVVGTTITMSAAATATNPGVTVTVGTGAPSAVRDLAVFQSRLWVLTGNRGVTFTGPGAFTTWAAIYAGGSATLTDPVFLGSITTLRAAMDLLWVFGASAINTISNVAVVSGVTTFQNENLVAGVGTSHKSSVQPLFRTMVFENASGVYAMLGATPQKLSDQLDGLLPSVADLSGDTPSAVFFLNNILVYAVLVTVSGTPRILVYSRPTWCQADQGSGLLWITTLYDAASGIPTCWGTDGTNVFQCFAGMTGNFTVSTKLFDFGAFTTEKTMVRLAIEAELPVTATSQTAPFTVTVENENLASALAIASFTFQTVTWQNNAGTPVTWVNNVGGVVTWTGAGRLVTRATADFSGAELGMTLKGTTPGLTLGAVAMQIDALGEWTGG